MLKQEKILASHCLGLLILIFPWTHRTNVIPVVEEVGEAVEVGKCLVGRGEQGERPFPSQAAAQARRRHRANQGAEPATGVEIQSWNF